MTAYVDRSLTIALKGRPETDYPPDIVRHLKTPVIAECLGSGRLRAYVHFGDEHFFVCPMCNYRDANLPTARIEPDGWTWRCVRCDAFGTRWQLEQMLLASPEAVSRMLEIVTEWSP